MAADTFKNNATGFLANAIDAVVTSCTLKSGNGANFPAAPFIAQIDLEIVLVTALQNDTFTIQRGYEQTFLDQFLSFPQTAHAVNAPVSLGLTAGMQRHLWKNIPDRYNAHIPPVNRNLTASTNDDEFEWTSGLWTLTHSDANYTLTVNSPKSYLHITSTSSSGTYTYSQSFAPATTTWTALTRLLTAGRLVPANTWTAQLKLTATSGNTYAIGFTYNNYPAPATGLQPIEMVRADQTISSVSSYTVIPKHSLHELVGIRYDGYYLSLLTGQENAFTVVSKTYQPGLTASSIAYSLVYASPSNHTFHMYVDWFRETSP